MTELGALKDAMRAAFGKCPNCSGSIVTGQWLKWCNGLNGKQRCSWVAPR